MFRTSFGALRNVLGGRRQRAAYVVSLLLSTYLLHQLSYLSSVLSAHLPVHVIQSCPAWATGIPRNLQNTTSSRDKSEDEADSTIPRVLHQTWKTRDLSTYPRKASYEAWENALEPFNYTIKIWSDADILHLIRDQYPWVLPTFEDYDLNIQRADLGRLLILHSEGGIYADMDVYPISDTIDEIVCLSNSGVQGVLFSTCGSLKPSNHFIMATKGSPLLLSALKHAVSRADSSKQIAMPYFRVFWSTGPMMMDSAVQKYMSMTNSSEEGWGLVDESYSMRLIRHSAGRSWHGLDGYILNLISDHASDKAVWSGLLAFGFCLLAVLSKSVRRYMVWGVSRFSRARSRNLL